MTPQQTAQVRGFVAVLATYPETMKFKHWAISLRAFCAATGTDYNEAYVYMVDLRKELA